MQYPHIISSFLSPNILLSTLFSNNFSLCFSIYAADKVSHPFKVTGKPLHCYSLIIIFMITQQKVRNWMVASDPRIQSVLIHFTNEILIC
jgi:hypothetical protein